MDRLNTTRATCRSCSSRVDPEVARVLGDNEDRVDCCPNCIETTHAEDVTVAYALREMRSRMAGGPSR